MHAPGIFRASTTWQLGDGTSCKFWSDHWIDSRSVAEIAPLVHSLVPHRQRKSRTVSEALHLRSWVQDIRGALGPVALLQYVDLWRQVRHVELSATPDTLSWRWMASGLYSANSCYQALFNGSCKDPHWKLTWKPWASVRIRFFMWLAMQERCWTAERLARHGLSDDHMCALRDQEPETMQHLLAGCSFSRQIWHEVLGWVRAPTSLPDGNTPVQTWWATSTEQASTSAGKGLASIIILTAWWIWKRRNGCVFEHDRPSLSQLTIAIKDEARLWAKAGAAGISNIIPES